MPRTYLPLLALLACLVLPHLAQADDCEASIAAKLPGATASEFHGYRMLNFALDGIPCKLVLPKTPAEGRPWIIRARFFGHEPQTDIAMLGHGYHVAYIDVAGLFGAPKAVARFDTLYDAMAKDFGLSEKVVLEGFSRGGLIIYNWAIAHPDRVVCLYGDAPVCDFRSWPRKKCGPESGTWKQCLDAYGLTDEQAMEYDGLPADNLAPLAKAKIPVLHVVGQADTVVPVAENTDVIEREYRRLGGSITVIRKPGVDHHPHSLKDPAPIVEFILKAAGK